MRLANYLTEQRSQDVGVDFVTKWIRKNQAGMKSIIYRGVESTSNYMFVQPSKYERQSANTELNYYTLLFDNLPSWKQYPKRSRSIICATGLEITSDYGNTYRVFLKTGSKLGICPERDIWESFENFDRLEDFNYILKGIFKNVNGCHKDPYTYEQLEKNFSLIDKFKLDLFNDVRDMDREDREDSEEEYKAEGELDLGEVVERAIELATEIFDANIQDIRGTFFSDFLKSKKPFLKYLEDILKPSPNGFELQKIDIGMSLPHGNEVWSDGDAVLVLDEETDKILDSI